MLRGYAYTCSSIAFRDGQFVIPLLTMGSRSFDSVTTVGAFDSHGKYVRSFGTLPAAHRQPGLTGAYQTLVVTDPADSVLIGYSTLNGAFGPTGTQQVADFTGSRGDNASFLSA